MFSYPTYIFLVKPGQFFIFSCFLKKKKTTTRNVSTVHRCSCCGVPEYKCLNLSLTGSHTYVRTRIRTEGRIFVCTYPHTQVWKTKKLYAPGIIRYGGTIKKGGTGKTRNVSTVHGCPRCGEPDWKTAKFYLVQVP